MSRTSETFSAGQLAQVACLLEATARKPGNVHRFRDFEDAHYLEFLLSAAAITGPLDRASGQSLGRTILECVEATRQMVRTNTNLGMILLLAPMASVPLVEDLREGISRVLGSSTIEDAAFVYRAIRLAKPGGLGTVEDQDVEAEPTITLREAMILAEGRDIVARQYANGYADVFDFALPSLKERLEAGGSLESAIIGTFLEILAKHPDTLIARKLGEPAARDVSLMATSVLERGLDDSLESAQALGEFDRWLRDAAHSRNPGATADVTTAALFAALRDGTIPLPIAGNWSNPANP